MTQDIENLRQAIAAGRVISVGVLNTAYEVRLAGKRAFVRHRTLLDSLDYGQTFAAERFLPDSLAETIPIPKLQAVLCDETGRDSFAVFDFIEGHHPRWNLRVSSQLAEYLAWTHSHSRAHMGPVSGPSAFQGEPTEFIRLLFGLELQRLPEQVPNRSALMQLTELALRRLPRYDEGSVRLCHGDVRRENLIQDRAGSLWLVDWEAARYRVPSSDLNQLPGSWISENSFAAFVKQYARLTSSDAIQLLLEADLFRLLWHLRTFNFEATILRRSSSGTAAHLAEAERLARRYQ